MRFLLDTNVISELRKGARANPGVRAWIAATPASSLWTSALVDGMTLVTRNTKEVVRTGVTVLNPFVPVD